MFVGAGPDANRDRSRRHHDRTQRIDSVIDVGVGCPRRMLIHNPRPLDLNDVASTSNDCRPFIKSEMPDLPGGDLPASNHIASANAVPKPSLLCSARLQSAATPTPSDPHVTISRPHAHVVTDRRPAPASLVPTTVDAVSIVLTISQVLRFEN